MTTDDPFAPMRRAAEHAAAFERGLDARSPWPAHSPDAAVRAFDGPLPEHGADAAEVIDDLAARAQGGLSGTRGPRFFGWVIGGSHPAGVAAEWLASTWGQNAGASVAAPAACAAEQVAARWLLELLGLPTEASVGFVTGASVANLACLLAARDAVLRAAGWDVADDGLAGAPPVRVAIGDDAHTTVFAALRFAGFGMRRLLRVATDGAGRMDAGALQDALAAGTGPAIVVAQAGQINTGAFDPFEAIVPVARRHGAWLHVDGAFGLWARACPARAALAAGVDGADSWATDGHKWLQTPYDCGFAIVRDVDAHRRAMNKTASYLPRISDAVREPTDFVPELSRRARGFAVWATIRALGRDGMAALVERHCRLAQRLATRVAAEPGVTLANDVVLNQAILRFGADRPGADADALTAATIDAVREGGVCLLGGARWRGAWVMRVSVSGWRTDEAAIDASADAIVAAWRAVRSRA